MNDVFAFSRHINRMNEHELRSFMRLLYIKSEQVVQWQKEQGEVMDFANNVLTLLKDMDKPMDFSQMEQQELSGLDGPAEIHITIGDSSLGSLKIAMANVPGREGRRFISMSDYYAVGPLGDLTSNADLHRRHLWLMERLSLNDRQEYAEHGLDSLYELNDRICSIDEQTRITIWYANTAHERTGLLYAIHLLRNRKSPIYVIETSGLYQQLFNRQDVEYTILNTGEIGPEKLLKMWQACSEKGPLSIEERHQLEQEWLELSVKPGLLRLIKDGTLQSFSEDAMDEYIMEKVKELTAYWEPAKYIKSARIVGEVLGTYDQFVGDGFIEYRIRQLVLQGLLEMEGKPHAMRFYSIRLRA
ncbi:DUF1835 domain-containing protein [Paenibacillus pabuli]|uniref:DUF1835 domain-containing protein n=1 Tax=Paenibacillus pabuli TaxID=1472 RepID=UPI003242FE28